MPFSSLSSLSQEAPLRILLVDAGEGISISLAGVLQPLQLASRLLGAGRLQVDVMRLDALSAKGQHPHHIALAVAGISTSAG
jgi:hypothetical protein